LLSPVVVLLFISASGAAKSKKAESTTKKGVEMHHVKLPQPPM
jgi:hypothetical protein